MEMEPYERVPAEFYEAMLIDHEAHGVISWAVVSKLCLNLVKSALRDSRAFRLRYNTHQRREETSWTFQYVQDDAAHVGNVYGMLLDSNVARDTRLNHLIRNLVFDERYLITLVHIHGSYFVFTREKEGEDLFLIVVHFISGSANVLQCPPAMKAVNFIDHPESIRMFIDVKFDKRRGIKRMRFRLLHAFLDQVGGELVPRVCFYELGRGWFLSQKLAVPTLADPNIAATEFFLTLHHHDTLALVFVEEFDKPYYAVVDVDAVFTSIIPVSVSMFVTGHGWEFKMERIFSPFGGNGSWLAAICTHTHPSLGLKIIKMVSLFKYDQQDLDEGRPFHYTFVSTLPADRLDTYEQIGLRGCSCDATANHVQIGLVISKGVNLWQNRYLTYHIASRQWTTLDIDAFTASRVGLPRLTSRLTL